MKRHNYKKGDKVRITGNNGKGIHHHYELGAICIVERVGDGYASLQEVKEGLTQLVSLENIQHAGFNRDDIKAGYLLEVEDGRYGTTFYMTVVPSSRGDDDLGCCCPDKHWWFLSCFDEDTLAYRGPVFTATILRVYGPTSNRRLLANTPEERELLWERQEEPKVVEMTVAEISEKLGYEVKIVKEKIN